MNALRQKLKSMRTLVTLLIIVIIILFGILVVTRDRTRPLPAEALDLATVRTIDATVEVDGNIDGVRSTELSLPSGAKILEVTVKEGMRVSADELLLTYESTGFTGTTESELRAPFAGLVTLIDVVAGESVFNSTQPVVVITDDSSLVIELAVNENDIGDVKEDQPARLVFPALSFDDEYDATVSAVGVSPLKTGAAVNYPVTVTPEDIPQAVRLGMSVEVSIRTDRAENVLSVPVNFLIERDDNYFVKVITFTDSERSDYDIVETEVEVGLKTGTFAEVTSGIREGTQIIEPSFTVERSFGFF
ncbi:MAG: Macrolide export protein MacA [candidate division WS6 bacterium OLB20]|uniref:Macrolide export protein MacA n=1 Tax=candidate division WS6 bacterium OLB20 TaxID=1617426 RepID=A0A136LXS5_9BACT|nr:MAG: Macrolide export protein MacA [candidate division WS6 bacterium OLB20]